MINLARGSVILILSVVFLGVFDFTTNAESALAIAIDSQKELQQSNKQDKQKSNNKSTKQDNQEIITIEVENLPESKVAAINERLSSGGKYSATAYCLKGRTASGSGVRRGIVAADTRLLPLGTRISMDAGSYSGSYLVADTGGSVKGRKLDIWVPSCSEAVRFGRRMVTVAVVNKRK